MATAANILGVPALERTEAASLQTQLYAALREAILARRLRPGTRLPSSRTLAADVGVGRNTVVGAFAQLLAEGYVTARVGDGTRVAPLTPESLLEAPRPRVARAPAGRAAALSRRGAVLATTPRGGPFPDGTPFMPGCPAAEAFPLDAWARVVARHARRRPRSGMGYGASAGYPPLREAIATYVGAARGVVAEPSQVIVVAGAQAGIDLAARLLVDPGDPVWMEDPGYPGARAALLAAGARPVPVPVDAEGLDPEAGTRRSPDARVVYLTPSHQYPLGMVMSLPRRLALLERAARTGTWILEDDYDGEYRFSGRPLAALQGLDPTRVVFVGTFSKTMFPALRAGWLVVPPELVPAFENAIRHTGHSVPVPLQAALAEFVAGGQLAAHIRRMRTLYAARQDRLVRAARRRLGDRLVVEPTEAGMQLAALLPAGADDRALSQAAYEAGVVAAPLSAFYDGRPRRRGFLLGFSGIRERDIDRGVERLGRVLGC
ncbi:MAG: PLP-dependent aminotransferase family protein [bacterium]|nr:PLP-dependent aminotransferase family protein [bacterium]